MKMIGRSMGSVATWSRSFTVGGRDSLRSAAEQLSAANRAHDTTKGSSSPRELRAPRRNMRGSVTHSGGSVVGGGSKAGGAASAAGSALPRGMHCPGERFVAHKEGFNSPASLFVMQASLREAA